MARKKRVHASPMRPEIQGALWVAGLYGRLSVLDNGKVDGEPIESQIAIIEQYHRQRPFSIWQKLSGCGRLSGAHLPLFGGQGHRGQRWL